MSGSIPHSIEAQRFTSDRSNLSGNVLAYDATDHTESTSLARANSDYTVNVSEEAQELLSQEHNQQATNNADAKEAKVAQEENPIENDKDESPEKDTDQALTEEEQHEVEQMKKRDEEVRVHEQAHASTGGQYAGSPSYTYEQGPDGKRYITDGEVPIDVSTIANDPQATIDKMRQVYRAALAPAEPSSADRSIANEAQQKMAEAMADLSKETPENEPSNTQTYSNSKSTLESSYNSVDISHNSGSNVNLVA